MTDVPSIPLNDGNSIPQLGFGVWRLEEEDAPEVIGAAIDAGYRHIDTAQGYDNEAGVGRAIAEADVAREQLFITSKLRNSQQGFEKTQQSLDESLERLQLDYLDLFLIHWPAPAHDRYVDTWKALIEAQKQGKVKSIGVSNFLPEHIDRIIAETGVKPAVNQVELHPAYQQRDIRDYHRKKDIKLECYSPLGGKESKLLDDDTITEIGDRYDRSPAQIITRWHLQQGLIVIPKSSKPERARENFEVWDFELTEDDIAKIDALDRPDGKTLPQPNENNDLF
jgi:2,5-diketo-D-gluconate reductase A